VRIRYNGFLSDAGECSCTRRRTAVMGSNYLQYGWDYTAEITGESILSGPSAIPAKVAALDAAFSTSGYDLIVYNDDAATVLFTLPKVQIQGGVDFPNAGAGAQQGSEWVNKLTWGVTLTGRYALPQINPATILSFTESIEYSGGGPKRVFVEQRNGPPILQIPTAQTVYQAVQEGSMIGINKLYLKPPLPLFGTPWENPVLRPATLQPSQVQGTPFFLPQYQITWRYLFKSAAPLVQKFPAYW
jgi:hypothetical protein